MASSARLRQSCFPHASHAEAGPRRAAAFKLAQRRPKRRTPSVQSKHPPWPSPRPPSKPPSFASACSYTSTWAGCRTRLPCRVFALPMPDRSPPSARSAWPACAGAPKKATRRPRATRAGSPRPGKPRIKRRCKRRRRCMRKSTSGSTTSSTSKRTGQRRTKGQRTKPSARNKPIRQPASRHVPAPARAAHCAKRALPRARRSSCASTNTPKPRPGGAPGHRAGAA